jgi:hypothetical protein
VELVLNNALVGAMRLGAQIAENIERGNKEIPPRPHHPDSFDRDRLLQTIIDWLEVYRLRMAIAPFEQNQHV